MKSLVSGALALLLALGCDSQPAPGVQPPPLPPAPAALGTYEVYPAQTLVLELPVSLAVDGATVEATLGGAALTLVRTEPETLAFVVPSLAPGDHPLKLQGAGGEAEGSLRVRTAPVVQDAVAAIEATLAGVEARAAALREEVAGLPAPALDVALRDLDALQQQVDRVREQVAAAPAAQQQQLAQVLAVNAAAFGELLSEQQGSGRVQAMGLAATCVARVGVEKAWECIEKGMSIRLVVLVGSALIAATDPEPLTKSVAGLISVAQLYEMNLWLLRQLDQTLYAFGVELLAGLSEPGRVRAAATQQLIGLAAPGVTRVPLVASYRAVSAADEANIDRYPLLGRVLRGVARFQKLWRSATSLIPWTLETQVITYASLSAAPQRRELSPLYVRVTPALVEQNGIQLRPTLEDGALVLTSTGALTAAFEVDLQLRYEIPGVSSLEHVVRVHVQRPCDVPGPTNMEGLWRERAYLAPTGFETQESQMQNVREVYLQFASDGTVVVHKIQYLEGGTYTPGWVTFDPPDPGTWRYWCDAGYGPLISFDGMQRLSYTVFAWTPASPDKLYSHDWPGSTHVLERITSIP